MGQHAIYYDDHPVKKALCRKLDEMVDRRSQVTQLGTTDIDVILESLIDAAGGAGGLIKEFKDALSALA